MLLLGLLALTAASFRHVGGRRGFSRHGSCNLLADVRHIGFVQLMFVRTVKWLFMTGVQVTLSTRGPLAASRDQCHCRVWADSLLLYQPLYQTAYYFLLVCTLVAAARALFAALHHQLAKLHFHRQQRTWRSARAARQTFAIESEDESNEMSSDLTSAEEGGYAPGFNRVPEGLTSSPHSIYLVPAAVLLPLMLLPERWGASRTAVLWNAGGLLASRIAAVAAMQMWQWGRVFVLSMCAAAAVFVEAGSDRRPAELLFAEHAAELCAFVLALVWYSGVAEVVFAHLIMEATCNLLGVQAQSADMYCV